MFAAHNSAFLRANLAWRVQGRPNASVSLSMVTGFAHAPWTKGRQYDTTDAAAIAVLAFTSLLTALLDAKPFLQFRIVPHITTHHQVRTRGALTQFWQLAVYPFAYTNSSELFLGSLLLYHAGRPVERLFGTRKFSVRGHAHTALCRTRIYSTHPPVSRLDNDQHGCHAAASQHDPACYVARKDRYRLLARRALWVPRCGGLPVLCSCPPTLVHSCLRH